MGSLQPWLADRKAKRRKTGTINNCLQVVRRILNLAATEWIDGNDLTWLETPVKIKLLPVTDRKKPYPLNWEEQGRLFRELPPHLAEMALFAVNTGCRDAEICYLRWEYEIEVPSMNTSVFIVPEDFVKNGDERLIVLNRFAQSVIAGRRGKHPEWVFTFKGHNMTRMLNSAWRRARTRAGLPGVRVHDLKHTFGRRLRAAGVSFEDRQDLLGHRSGRITTHYSAAELGSLIEAANRVCDMNNRRPELVVLRGRVPQNPRNLKGQDNQSAP
jgi:integrase